MYIETELVLDSLDILNLMTLVDARVRELKAVKKTNGAEHPNGFVALMADDHLKMWRETQKKLKAAHENIKEIKRVRDAEYYASLKARRQPANRKPTSGNKRASA